ncbi:hypothetical protein C8Q74DRAFT_1002433 [Fomes fomentarius]|nr:hypothetical protein C8Q74DRAFT_1002433 [Fomes fomentarius]
MLCLVSSLAQAVKMPVPIAVAELISLAIQPLIFGAFTISHCITIWILSRGKRDWRSYRVNLALFIVSSLLWVLSAAHLGLTVQRALEAFVGHAEDTNRIAAFYSRLSDKKHVAQDSIYVTNVLINDSFLTYRLFVVWNRDWRVIVLPTLLLLGTAISGYGAVIYVANIPGEGSIFTALSLTRFLNALFTLPLATNLLLTCLIAGRIAWMRYETRKVTTYAPIGRSYWGIVDILPPSRPARLPPYSEHTGQSRMHIS